MIYKIEMGVKHSHNLSQLSIVLTEVIVSVADVLTVHYIITINLGPLK